MQSITETLTSSARSARGARLAWLAALLAPVATPSAQDQHHHYTFRGSLQDDFGRAVAAAGDLDDDGRPDFVVGATQRYTSHPGYVRAYSGRTGAELYEVVGAVPMDAFSDRFGAALATLPDMDGDGANEIVVGAPRDDDAGTDAGRIDLLSGATGIHLLSLTGEQAGARFGALLAAAGDVDDDGLLDLLVASPGSGRVEVISGAWLSEQVQSQPPSGAQVLFSATGAPGFGESVAVLEDVDGDGRPDYAVGAQDEGGVGVVRVYSGASQIELLSLQGSFPEDRYGRGLASAGDWNGDGRDDLGVGIPGDDTGGPNAGRLRVISGEWIAATALAGTPVSAEVLYEAVGATAGDGLGHHLRRVGDVDGDGVEDLAASALQGASVGIPPYVSIVSGADGSELLLRTSATPQDLRGVAIAGVGDIDLDGQADVLLGAPRDGLYGEGSASLVSGRSLELTSDKHLISVVEGGTAQFSLDAGVERAGDFYIVLGGFSGTEPGLPTPVGVYPLNFDGYSNYTLIGAPEFVGFQGLIDAQGRASAQLQLVPNAPPSLVGFQLHFAYFTLDLGAQGIPTTLVSNAVPVGFFLDDCAAVDPADDCNQNGINDVCEIADGSVSDCNQNGVPDSCDLLAGTSLDGDFDGVPDECTLVVYVDEDANGTNDGSSWTNAYRELRDAISAVDPFTQIWVAEGTYVPTESVMNEGAAFLLRNNVGIYGGFSGVETSLDQRDWVAHPTVLSGDVLGDDLPDFVQWEDNTWSVVQADATADHTAVLDGFTLTHGYAHETAACDVFAVFFTSCRGGAGYLLGSPTVRNCTMVDNFGGHHGGAVFTSAAPRFLNCRFVDNGAFLGGAVYVDAGGEPEFYNCVFEENGAIDGGAIYTAGQPGDTVYLFGCRLNGNDATGAGGATYTSLALLQMVNCTVTNNTAQSGAGGLEQDVATLALLDNSILWANTTAGSGGQSAQFSALVQAQRCQIEGWSGAQIGPLTSGDDPQLVDIDGADGIPGNADDDLRLQPSSPCVDSGSVVPVPFDDVDFDRDGDLAEKSPLDLDGQPRILDDPGAPNAGVGLLSGAVVDRGAYERPGTP